MSNCPICIESIESRNPITCNSCAYTTCSICTQTYLLSLYAAAQCMNCHVEWTWDFLFSNFTQSWLKTKYRKYCKQLLLNREKARLSEVTSIIPHVLTIDTLRKETHDDINILERSIQSLQNQLDRVKIQRGQAWRNINILDETRTNLIHESTTTTSILTCPHPECTGLIVNSICHICSRKICERCHDIYTESHQCDTNILTSIEFIKNDTKPCPICHVPIHRIQGCADMWCTQCRTPFNWNTGNIIRGNFHNPHVHNNRNEHPNRPNNIAARRECRDIWNISIEVWNTIETFRTTIHNMEVSLRKLRVSYLCNYITEDHWKNSIFRHERIRERKYAEHRIYSMCYTRLVEIMQLYTQNINSAHECNILAISLLEYTNEQFTNTLKALGGTRFPYIRLQDTPHIHTSYRNNADPRLE